MFDLSQFTLGDVLTCGAALRGLSAGGQPLERVAQHTVDFLFQKLRDGAGKPGCVLVRCFRTTSYSDLKPDLQSIVRSKLGEERPAATLRCFTLLATRGVEEDWCECVRSKDHRVLPLPSADFLSEAPMLARLVQQFGLRAEDVAGPADPDLEQGALDVFHVAEAAGSPYVPAQDTFVQPYEVRSVLAFGGMLPGSDLFAFVLFCRVPVSSAIAELFKTLALSVKLSLLAAGGGASAASPELSASRQRTELQTLRHLLEIHEHAMREEILTAGQRRRLHEQNTPLGVIDWDLEFRVVEWNPGAERIFGYSRQEALRRHAADLVVAPEARAHVDAIWASLVKQSGGTRSTNSNITKAGRTIYCEWYNTPLIDEDGRTVGVASLIMDVTEREEAAQALRESEARYRAAQTAANIANLDCDLETGLLSGADELLAMFGCDQCADSPTLLGLLECVLEEDRASLQQAMERVRDGHPVELEVRVAPADSAEDDPRWVYVRADLVGETSKARLLGIAQDISERKAAQAEQQSLTQQVQRAQKLESLGVLAGGIAHDFNNLLVSFYGNTDLLRMELLPNCSPQVEGHIKELRDAAERAAELTRQLLSVGRQQHFQPRAVQLNEQIRGVLRFLRRTLPESIEVDFIPGHALDAAKVDPSQFDQVMMNLCINASHAMPDGGRLTLETSNVLVSGDFSRQHPWATPGRYVLTSITDTGTGMSEETQERIFDPFFTTKPQGRGTGLGLAVVHGIVTRHEGMIHPYSELGVGTTFKVYLPVAERMASAVSTLLQGEAKGGTERILLAEDDPAVQRVATEILERAGYTVVLATTGAEAISLVEDTSEVFDLAVLDVVLPGGSGRDVFEAILRGGRGPGKVLFCSGYSTQAWPDGFFDQPGRAYVSKPYDGDALLRKVRELLDGPA